MLRRILRDVAGRLLPPSSRGVVSSVRGSPDREEEKEEEAMFYWTIASIWRLEIVPPGRSGPSSSSGSCIGSRGGSNSLLLEED